MKISSNAKLPSTLLSSCLWTVCLANSSCNWRQSLLQFDWCDPRCCIKVFWNLFLLFIHFDYYLFTGKVCYLVVDETDTFKNKLINLVIGIIGNFIGCIVVGLVIRFIFHKPDTPNLLFASLNNTVETKLNYPWYTMIILGIFCGFFIYFAVEGFKKIENPIGKYVVLILCIGAFIICGFEHCVANMFYYALNGTFTLKMVLATIYCIIGNSIGGLFFPFMHTLLKK